jgi:hypothetical protein
MYRYGRELRLARGNLFDHCQKINILKRMYQYHNIKRQTQTEQSLTTVIVEGRLDGHQSK